MSARSQNGCVPSATTSDAEPSAARDLTLCMECGRKAEQVGGRAIYPHRPDLYAKRFYRCVCGAYVGCHPGTSDPLGYPAGPVTRKARSAAHAAFDPLWKSKRMTRSDAYKWLAGCLGKRASETHISWMNAEEAAQVVAHCHALQNAQSPVAAAKPSPQGDSGTTKSQTAREGR